MSEHWAILELISLSWLLRSFNHELIPHGLAHNIWKKCHLLGMHLHSTCIWESWELMCICMEDSILILYLSCVWWCCCPITKGAVMEPRAYVRCSHMISTRSALGILVVRMLLATHILLLNLWLSSQSLTHCVGDRVVLTCIMSTISHEHVHRVFISMCITPTFKIIAP
jgi:hypothetical protein